MGVARAMIETVLIWMAAFVIVALAGVGATSIVAILYDLATPNPYVEAQRQNRLHRDQYRITVIEEAGGEGDD